MITILTTSFFIFNWISSLERRLLECNRGYYLKDGICTPCPVGSSSSPGDLSCTPCERGTYSGTAGSSCQQCDLNRFSNTTGAASCKACPRGFVSEKRSGATYCKLCEAGTYLSNLFGFCFPCREGSYSKAGATGDCTPCPKGSTTYGVFCDKCDTRIYPKNETDKCTNCLPGSSSSGGVTICRPCGKGYYSSTSTDGSVCK